MSNKPKIIRTVIARFPTKNKAISMPAINMIVNFFFISFKNKYLILNTK